MGLDMYITGDVYIRERKDENGVDVDAGKLLADRLVSDGVIPDGFDGVMSISLHLAYWRKAYAIHEFFLNRLVSYCSIDRHCINRNYYHRGVPVRLPVLVELVRLCKDVLAHKDKAYKILPAYEGSHSLTDDYDEYYFDYIADTILILEEIIRRVELIQSQTPRTFINLYYHASW